MHSCTKFSIMVSGCYHLLLLYGFYLERTETGTKSGTHTIRNNLYSCRSKFSTKLCCTYCSLD
jgi:hypothetical protein